MTIKRVVFVSWAFLLSVLATRVLPDTDLGSAISLAVMGTALYPLAATTILGQQTHWELRYFAVMAFVVVGNFAVKIEAPSWAQVTIVVSVLGGAGIATLVRRSRRKAEEARQ